MISFTGSTAVGKRIMANGADTLKRVFLELGGKSANIILDDADFPAQMGSGAMVCMHGGQGCAITTRMLVPRLALRRGRRAAAGRRSRRWTLRRPDRPGEPAGPAHQRAPARAGARAHREGQERGRAARSSAAAAPAQFEKGYYVEPTLFVDVDPDSTIAQEEIFGPVLAVIPYEDDDDAVRIANNSRYGLSGAVNGTDLDRAYGIAKRLRTGHGRGERRPVVRSGLAVRRLQGVGPRARARHRRLRGVPRDQDGRAAAAVAHRLSSPASSRRTRSSPRRRGVRRVAP